MPVAARKYGSAKNAVKSIKGGGGGGTVFRNLKPDEEITVRFLDEPDQWIEAIQHYYDGGFHWCTDDDCDGCERGERASKRSIANAVEISDKGQVIPLQMPVTVAEALIKRYQRYKTICDRDYIIAREGSGQMDTTYSVDPEEKSPKNLSRFDSKKHDILSLLNKEAGVEDEDDDEEPRSSKSKRPVKKSRARDDDDFDDEEDDIEAELDREERKRGVLKKSRRVQDDEDFDDEEDEDDEDDEEEEDRSRRSAATKRRLKDHPGGMEEFSTRTSTAKRRIVRR